jgi:hypothetical protein
MKIDELAQRREKRIQSRQTNAGLRKAHKALAERHAIMRALKAMPLKKLRAIHNAAQQAFSTKQ